MTWRWISSVDARLLTIAEPDPGLVQRSELLYTMSNRQWSEHFWWVSRTFVYEPADFDNVAQVMQDWYNGSHVEPRVTRQQLLPDVVNQLSVQTLTWAADLLKIGDEIYDAILVGIGSNENPPLPLNVSKEFEWRTRWSGRGNYSRIHIGGLAADDVDVDDVTRMASGRMAEYIDCYQHLRLLLAGVDLDNGPYSIVQKHRVPNPQSDDPFGWWSYVLDGGMRSPYFGTMQGRSPGHRR